ncbi:WD repeat-containing protein 46 [Daktulosphaira vitifoliae]|uniref:WD repeat-containing protein 46 n=1 Tax=Daktulosphaira vitifoliae TaxID=58002 RepID=UPI0021AA6A34|nr:WD repeat-containing protein 46 [Daktulosphaira vitifoliae]
MGKVHQRRIKKETTEKLGAKLLEAANVLLPETSGYIIAENGEKTTKITQTQLSNSVDVTSAQKHFDLCLDFGPYDIDYSLNGRQLLIGGRKGHVAAMDWITKYLMCEINVMEEVYDVKWLHNENLFSVAQKKWVYIYDNQGVEVHCLKNLNNVLHQEFLPYHFLLSTVSEEGFLSWVDVSIGKMVQQFNAKMGRLSLMSQNPSNAMICIGNTKGVVSFWSPNLKEPVAKILCHGNPITSLAVNNNGLYMATTGLDRRLKVWDMRQFRGPLQEYKLRASPRSMVFSQKGYLALAINNVVDIYEECCTKSVTHAYLRHNIARTIKNLAFCPFEDVLGAGHDGGFSSLLIPGSGEPNFDALERNPFQTKKQRKEAEVKMLLEKIPAEMIALESTVDEIDVNTLKNRLEQKNSQNFGKPTRINIKVKSKLKRKTQANPSKVKQKIYEEKTKEFVRTINSKSRVEINDNTQLKRFSALDRFQNKKKKSKQ